MSLTSFALLAAINADCGASNSAYNDTPRASNGG